MRGYEWGTDFHPKIRADKDGEKGPGDGGKELFHGELSLGEAGIFSSHAVILIRCSPSQSALIPGQKSYPIDFSDKGIWGQRNFERRNWTEEWGQGNGTKRDVRR